MTKSVANFAIVGCLLLGAVFSTNPIPRGHCTTGSCLPGADQADFTPAAYTTTRIETKVEPAPPQPAASPPLSSPRLNLILPRGIQRGQTSTLEFSGQRLGDAQEIFFYSPGFTVQSVERIDNNRIKAEVAVAADVPVGRHIAQVRTASGISDYRPIWVNHLPTVAEVEPNNDLASAQPIPLNVVVDGVITNEDVDYYAVQCQQGQRLSVEVVGMRLGSFLFDPYIAILDADRFELAVSDDTALAAQDGVCSVQIPSEGTYYIMVRESSFGGNDQCRYQLHVGTFPRPTAVYPAGGPLGESLQVQYLGDALGPIDAQMQLPSEMVADFQVFPENEDGLAPSGMTFRLSEHPNAMEVEPNNGFETATPIEFPSAINGIISEEGDQDFYSFTAQKGQVWDIEVYSRRIRSGLDPVLDLWDAEKKHLGGNDDSRGPDSYLRWTVPEDGQYYLRIRDHLGRGREDFVYRVEFQPATPKLSFGIPRIERYGQYRQTISVPQGGRFGTLILAERANFGGELVLEDDNLPEGVTLQAQPMAANLSQMPAVFAAAEDAPIGGRLITLTGRHADTEQNIRGHFRNLADFVLGEPNNSQYETGEVEQLAIAVVERLPFRIEIQQPQSPIVQTGTKEIKVIVHRDEGFAENVVVEFPFRSPGIGTRGNIEIPGDQNEGLYPLNAAGNAQVGQWPVYVIGRANVGGPAWSSSQLATLEVSTPYLNMTIPRAGCEQGETVLVPCEINHLAPFEGEARAELFGLPPHCEVEPVMFTAETEEIVFTIKTSPETNAGKHKGVFCQVTVQVNGEPVVSRAGEFELQVDVPLPKEEPQEEPKQEEAVAPPAEEATPPPVIEKPLSRLEKLRLEAQERQQED